MRYVRNSDLISENIFQNDTYVCDKYNNMCLERNDTYNMKTFIIILYEMVKSSTFILTYP